MNPAPQPWLVHPDELVSWRDTLPIDRTLVPPPADYSEAGMHEWSIRVRTAQTAPSEYRHFPVGSWGLDAGGDLMQLRLLDIQSPAVRFPEGLNKYNPVVQKYAEWIRSGHEPIPGRATELYARDETTKFVNVDDGHHRAAAMLVAGRRAMPFWVSITVPRYLENGSFFPTGLRHADAVAAAVAEGRPVPLDVRRAFDS